MNSAVIVCGFAAFGSFGFFTTGSALTCRSSMLMIREKRLIRSKNSARLWYDAVEVDLDRPLAEELLVGQRAGGEALEREVALLGERADAPQQVRRVAPRRQDAQQLVELELELAHLLAELAAAAAWRPALPGSWSAARRAVICARSIVVAASAAAGASSRAPNEQQPEPQARLPRPKYQGLPSSPVFSATGPPPNLPTPGAGAVGAGCRRAPPGCRSAPPSPVWRAERTSN